MVKCSSSRSGSSNAPRSASFTNVLSDANSDGVRCSATISGTGGTTENCEQIECVRRRVRNRLVDITPFRVIFAIASSSSSAVCSPRRDPDSPTLCGL